MKNAEHTSKISKRKAFGTLIPLLFLCVFISSTVISVANDMYAFVKPLQSVTVSISSELSANELSDLLQENKVIKNDFVFTLYLRAKKKANDVPLLRGEFTLNSNMSYREILQTLF